MRRLALLLLALGFALAAASPALAVVGDQDGDADVDRLDVEIIFDARNTPAGPGDPKDLDADGVVTVLDARIAAACCTRPSCAIGNPPTIVSSATPSAAENQTFVVDVEATDLDGDTEGSGLTYSLTGGADAALFAIDPATGVLTFAAAPDFEAPADADADNVYEVQVTVTDSDGDTDVQDLQVTVTDVNEAPTITSSATPSVPENQTAATDVETTDAEDAEGSGLVYSLTGGADAALFSIDPATGVLTFDAAPDFEAPADADADNVYEVQVTVTDSGGLTDVQDLQVTVTDVSENGAPTITSSATPSAAENQTTATDVDSTDPEGDVEGSGLTYAITGGADGALFTIDPNTGVLSFNAAPDFESPGDADADNVYEVQVTVTDSGGLTDVQDLQVTVTDEDEAPSITSSSTPSAPENQTTATDVDSSDPEGDTEGAGLTYAITGGADAAQFSIDPNTGVLTFGAAPDFEAPGDADTNNVYEVQVTVTDSGGLTDVQDLQVTVTDANEAPSITSSATPSAPENQTGATDVDSTDPEGDTEGAGLTYAITGGADAAQFAIDPNTGVLTFGAAPDFEAPGDADTNNVYEVQVTVTDSGGLTDVQDLQVTVTDENEAPSITSSATPSAAENQTTAIDVDSSDPEDAEGSGLTYSITGGADGGLFTIDPNTGVLSFNAAPDFESPGDADTNNVYEVQVTVTDSGGLTDVQDLQVTVTDGNDAPTITSGATPSAPENQTAVTDVQSSDDNDAEGSGLTYSITGGADGGLFSIVPATGVLTFSAAPDFEAPGDANTDNVYEVQVTVTDSGGLTGVQDLQVTVTDVNDPPTISMIADQMTDEDVATGPIPFIVDDQETAAGSLVVTATSSNQTIIPDANLTLGGAGMNRTIDVLPAMNQNGGPVTITVTVDDGTAMTSELFDVTVNPVNDPPVGTADVFDFVGNTQLRVDLMALPAVPSVDVSTVAGTTPAADGVLDNDADPVEGSAVSVVGVRDGTSDCADATPPFTDCPTANGGRVTMEGNGQFLYTPLPGDMAATDSFEYRLSDGTDNVIVGVTLNRFARVWYVENDHPGLDEGTSTDPFTALGAAEAASLEGDVIFVHEGDGTSMGHNAGIRLKPGQKLLGEGVDLVLDLALNGGPPSTTLFDSVANNHPAVEHTAGDGVTVLADLADHLGVEIRGLLLSGTGNAIDVTAPVATPHSVEVTIADNFIVDSGAEAIDLNPESAGTFVATVADNAFATSSPDGNAIDVVAGAGAGQVEVAIDRNVDVTSQLGTAIRVDGTLGVGTLFVTSLSDNTVHGTTTGTGGIRVAGATFDADPTTGAIDVVAGGSTVIGAPATRVSGHGLDLEQVRGRYDVTALETFNANGTGLRLANPAPLTPADFTLDVGGGTGVGTNVDTFMGPALDLDPATVNAVFGGITSSFSPTTGVRLKDVDGSVSIGNAPSSLIGGSTGTAFEVDGGRAMVFYGGLIDNNSGFHVEVKNRPATASDVTFSNTIGGGPVGQGISVASNASGQISFDGAVNLDTGANDAVSLVSNAGAVVRFTGDLDIDTTTGIGFRATAGGTVEVLSGGAVSTTVDVGALATHAVDMNNVTIGLGDVTFDSITAAGGCNLECIDLDNVSNAGTFNGGVVDVNGTASGAAGIDVATSSAAVNFASVAIDGAAGEGIFLNGNTGSFQVTGATAIGATAGAAGASIRINGGTGGVTFAGVDVDNRGQEGILINGGNQAIGFGATTIDNQGSDPARALVVQNTTGGSVTLSSLAIDNAGAVSGGVDLVNNAATVDIQNASSSITGAGGTAFRVDTGAADVTYSGTITNVAGNSVLVNGRTGGLVDFAGAIDDDGNGIRLTDNGGGTVRFRGGLALDTGASDAFSALNLFASGGSVEVCDTANCAGGTAVVNSIGATTPISGVGVDLFDHTIGANGVTFREVHVNGATNGILLNATGSSGAFEVTGTGSTDGSGGTIQSTTGDAVTADNVRGGLILRNMILGDAAATVGQAKDTTNNVGGDGIDLVGVDDVTLTNMRIARTNNHGIDGTDVTNFAISDSEIFNAGDANGDSGISFEGVGTNNLDGTATVTNTVIDGPVEFGMRVQNSSGTLGLTVSGSQFSGTANTASLMFGEDGLQIEVLGTAQTTARIHNSNTFSMLESDGVMATTSESSSAVLNITIEGNTFTGFDNGAPNMRSDNAIELNATGGTNAGNAPALRYTIHNNTINSSSNSAILIGANDFTRVDGRITNNVINGSLFGFGIEAPLSADDSSVARLLVTNNNITNHNQQGAFFNVNNSGDLDITFDNNMVTTQPTDTTAFENVSFQVTAGALCVSAAGNTIALGGADAFGPGVGADALAMIRAAGTAQLEVGSAMLADPPATVLSTNNPAAASVFTAGTISVVTNGTCQTPILTPLP